MGICAEELREFVIQPTLKHLEQWSIDAETLLLGTAAQESGLGFHLTTTRGQGLGLYQITPNTHLDIWDNYLAKDADLASKIRGLASQHEFLASPHAELATNLSYSTAIAWMIYQRQMKNLPKATHIRRQANCWQKCFRPTGNTEDYINSYRQYIQHKEAKALAA